MSHALISRSADLKRLRDEGYDIEVRSNYLLMKSIPYVNKQLKIEFGTLVSELSLAGDTTTKPTDHVVRFAGDEPCDHLGRPLDQLINSRGQQILAEGIVIDFTFSQKPIDGYPDYFEKMTTYAAMLTGFAQTLDRSVTCKIFPFVANEDTGSIFQYIDTASSRAGIVPLSEKLKLNKVGIVGLGGTGSYILDLVAKTEVQEIHLFDGDRFLQHNAFRSPGAPSIDDLQRASFKSDYHASIYRRMHRGVVSHPYGIDSSNVDDLKSMDFVFISIDSGESKRLIMSKLEEFGAPFIDVGMGIYEVDGTLGGQVRITTSTEQQRDHLQDRVSCGTADDNEYSLNIQIADLNALNAALAVIKWKKLFGFYADLDREHSSVYVIDGNGLLNEVQAQAVHVD